MGEHDRRLAGLRGELATPVTAKPAHEIPVVAVADSQDIEEAPETPQPQSRLDALRAAGPVGEH